MGEALDAVASALGVRSSGPSAKPIRRLDCRSAEFITISTEEDLADEAWELRPLLEGFLRVTFVKHCPPGRLLGEFLAAAKQATNNGSPIMSDDDITELDNLREYVNQFHHNTSKNWQENLSSVNEQQLKGYAGRVVSFTRLARPTA